jgi:hypothetical protein
LANYNKFEFQNPYRLRLEDFVNEGAIRKIITSTGGTCSSLRTQYVDIQDDLPEGWSLASTFGMFGLGSLVGSKPAAPVIDPEVAKEMFAKLFVSSCFHLEPQLTEFQSRSRGSRSPSHLRLRPREQALLLQLRNHGSPE